MSNMPYIPNTSDLLSSFYTRDGNHRPYFQLEIYPKTLTMNPNKTHTILLKNAGLEDVVIESIETTTGLTLTTAFPLGVLPAGNTASLVVTANRVGKEAIVVSADKAEGNKALMIKVEN